MSGETQGAEFTFKDLLRASWVRTSIKLGLLATVVGLVFIWLLKVFNFAAAPLFENMEIFLANYGLAGIFILTVLSGTIIPLGSPALVAAASIFLDPLPLAIVASIGFTVGMSINYLLAYWLGRPFVIKRISSERLDEITRIWSKWGLIIYVLFGLTPVLPVELLSFVCGLLKTRATTFLILSFVPRFVVFTLFAYFGQYLGDWIAG
ncbi:TPA: DedA family protein [Candidatus Bathyarchaeota archaeon]|nr:DedA family protein [Candidatus Bathyarchaeota archaeon]HIJ08168.1 DedA family protein [Candidatus Bathyarchaeota archaeon]